MRILLELDAAPNIPGLQVRFHRRVDWPLAPSVGDRVQLVDRWVVEPTVKHLTFLVDGTLRVSLGLHNDTHHDLIGEMQKAGVWHIEGEVPNPGFEAW